MQTLDEMLKKINQRDSLKKLNFYFETLNEFRTIRLMGFSKKNGESLFASIKPDSYCVNTLYYSFSELDISDRKHILEVLIELSLFPPNGLEIE